jgi:hypothetical protein
MPFICGIICHITFFLLFRVRHNNLCKFFGYTHVRDMHYAKMLVEF